MRGFRLLGDGACNPRRVQLGSNLFQNKHVDLENRSERQGEGDPNPSDSALLLPRVAGTTQVSPASAPRFP
jgi:hypothetical protein